MKLNNFFKLVIAIIISELAGLIGSIFTAPSIPTWYTALTKPAFNPPSWIFGPVWTMLYALMGIALFLVWKQHSHILQNVRMLRAWKIGIGFFIFQLILNIVWSIIFFGLHNPFWAFIDLIALWLAIVITIIYFHKISKSAAFLFIPYILWVSFAGYLNYSIWQLQINAPESVVYTMETKYIHPQVWPPQISITSGSFHCDEGGLGINSRPGMTIQKKIGNIVYCIDSASEGTAGTFYTSYTYTFLKDDKLVKLSFTLAYPQCDNYNDSQKTECEQERQTFDLDTLISHIAEGVQL